MESILAAQLPIMIFCQKLMNPVTSVFVTIVTMFGEAVFSILALMIFAWCIDKKKGALILANIAGSNYFLNVFKVIARVPRPFTVFPDKVINMRPSTATGYSFPSGHSNAAATLLGTLAYIAKKTWFSLCAGILILGVCASRVFLGAHWPMDVIVGALVGLSFVLFFSRWFERVYDDTPRYFKFLAITFVVCTITGLISVILLEAGKLEVILWKDLMEGSAMGSGAAVGYYWERKKINYVVPKEMKKKVLTFLVGFFPAILGWLLIKSIPVFPFCFKFLGYFYLAVYATYIHPVVGVKLGLFGKESA